MNAADFPCCDRAIAETAVVNLHAVDAGGCVDKIGCRGGKGGQIASNTGEDGAVGDAAGGHAADLVRDQNRTAVDGAGDLETVNGSGDQRSLEVAFDDDGV